MITLTKFLPYSLAKKVSAAYILSLKSAFGGTPLEEDFWVQTDEEGYCALIARCGGRLYLCSNGMHIEELKSFLKVIGCSEIFTEEDTARALGLNIVSRFNVLYRRASLEPSPLPAPDTSRLYAALSLGSDGDIALPDYEDFAPDISHRLRHGAAAAIAEENGGGLAFLYEGGGIINGISVAPDHRGEGLGSDILNRLCGSILYEVYACAGDSAKDFYIKNCFAPKGTAVIAKEN